MKTIRIILLTCVIAAMLDQAAADNADGALATEHWPATLPAAFAGDSMTIDRITISPKSGESRARYDDLMIGPDLSMVDAPHSSMLITAEAVLNPDSQLSKGFVESLRATGANAFRHWADGPWWNPLGAEATIRTLVDEGHEWVKYDTEQKIADWPKTWPDGFQVIDFFASRGFDQSLTVATNYVDPDTGKVYRTRQVCNDVDGVLARAAQANAGSFARHFRDKGYKTRLVIEIGNEAVGYDKDGQPSELEYARMCRAYIDAVKWANPTVEVAAVGGRTGMEGVDPLYSAASIGMGSRRFFRALGKDMTGKLDHYVLHIYDGYHYRDLSNARVSDIPDMLDNWRSDLDAEGFAKTRIFITEYRFNLWNRSWQTVGAALAEAARMMMQVANRRVSGVFIYCAPISALFNYSDGTTWTLVQPPGESIPVETKNGHIVDTKPDLGPRYRILPTGYVQQLLAETCRGELVDAMAVGDYGAVTYLLTREGPTCRLLVANLQSSAVQINAPGLTAGKTWVFQGTSLSAEPADTIDQPYGIKETVFDGNVPPSSLTLILLHSGKEQ